MAHLYTRNGTKLVTEEVRRSVESTLAIKGIELNCEESFSNQKDIIGV